MSGFGPQYRFWEGDPRTDVFDEGAGPGLYVKINDKYYKKEEIEEERKHKRRLPKPELISFTKEEGEGNPAESGGI